MKRLNRQTNRTATTPTRRLLLCALLFASLFTASCKREPILNLHHGKDMEITLPTVELELNIFWDYVNNLGIPYDWQAEWFYGWDDEDRKLFGEMGYNKPDVFNLRRYFTDSIPNAPHTTVLSDRIVGYRCTREFSFGYWDLLSWNDIETLDGIQSLIFDEQTTLDCVTAYTNQTMMSSRYNAPRYTRSFYQPEAVFSGYERALEVNKNLDGFVYDPVEDVWVKEMEMMLYPRTYIYLVQIILHNNNGKIKEVDANANLSGMARSVNLNTGVAGEDAITVHYNVRLKNGCDMNGESVDIIGGRLMTFGMCNIDGSRAEPVQLRNDMEPTVNDDFRHYMDICMRFDNDKDSTFVFDVTDQVRRRYKGGVLTIELDMDTIDAPIRSGGSAFDAVVEDFEDGGTVEFPL